MSNASAPRAHGATWRWKMVAVMSALYVEVWPQPTAPVSVVSRTKHTNSLAKVSRQAIFIRRFPRAAPATLARLPVHGRAARSHAATGAALKRSEERRVGKEGRAVQRG